MSTAMQNAVQRYLVERRSLGFDLAIAGGQLLRFARFADSRGHSGPLTLELQLDWSQEHVRRTSSITWARRLEVVRPFAAYFRQFEPQTEVPDLHTFGRGHRRLAPHIYSEREIVELLDAAGRLNGGILRPATYRTLLGLMAATGLRLSEALRLRDSDVDVRAGLLTVRQTKFNKSRQLSLHATTVAALAAFRGTREQWVPRNPELTLFASGTGSELAKRSVHHVFDQLRRSLNWVARGDYPRPRIHDLRHTFAVRRVQRWHQDGTSLEHAMLMLCTYLGHAKISDTYWYLSGVPELMSVVGERFERFVCLSEHTHV